MAAYNDARSVQDKTLTGTTADTVTINQLWPAVEITNQSTTNALYIRMDGTTAVGSASGTTRVGTGETKVTKAHESGSTGTIVISIVGNGNTYSVEGVE